MDKDHGAVHLQRLGMKRRKKETRHMKIMSGLTVLFLVLTLLFQDNMNCYQMEMNYQRYGEWFLRCPIGEEDFSHPYLDQSGEIWTGSEIYLEKEEDANTEAFSMPPTDDSRYTGILLGTMDSQCVDMGHIQLYDGRMPEREDEIAMELGTLQALGCDYDLGQEITFYVAETNNVTDLILAGQEMKMHRVTYRLAGTVKSYTSQWNNGESLPGALVSRKAFGKLTMAKEGYSFYKLKPEYAENVSNQFAEELWDSLKNSLKNSGEESQESIEEMGYAYNSFAYGNEFWGNAVMYRNMTILLLFLGSSVMAYLMSSYLSKRRPYYYRMREIGASIMQIWKMACYECVWSAIPAAALSLILSYVGSILIVWGIARHENIPFFYVFRVKTLAAIILCVVIILALAMITALFLFHAKRLTDNRREVPKMAQRSLRHRSEKRKKRLDARELLKRERMCHPVSVLFVRLLGVLACTAVLCCMMQIYDKVVSYRFIKKICKDYIVNTPEKLRMLSNKEVPVEPYIDSDGVRRTKIYMGRSESYDSMESNIPEIVREELNELSGIGQLRYSTRDQSHVFEWDGKGESDYYQKKTDGLGVGGRLKGNSKDVQEVIRYTDMLLYGSRFFEDFSDVWNRLKGDLDQEIADYDKLCRGKQVILLYSDEEFMVDEEEEDVDTGEQPETKFLEWDSTLKEGDLLTIRTKGKPVSVEIAGILSVDQIGYSGYGHNAYNIVGSGALGRAIAKEDQIEYGYNYLEIDLNALSGSEATGKIITRLCDRYGLIYESDMEIIRDSFKKIIQSALVYGLLCGIVFVLYVFVLSCILQEEGRKRRPRRIALHQLGMPLGSLRYMDILDGVREGICLLSAVPALYIMWIFKLKEEWRTDKWDVYAMESIFFDKTVYNLNEGKYVFYRLLDYINIRWWLVFMVIVFGIVVCLHVKITARKEG